MPKVWAQDVLWSVWCQRRLVSCYGLAVLSVLVLDLGKWKTVVTYG